MKVVKPIPITDSVFVSSNVLENDAPVWNSGSTYAVGDDVIRTVAGTHKLFRNKIAGANANLPENDSTRWQDRGATNRWKMFDGAVNSLTTRSSPITVELAPGLFDSLGLLELTAEQVLVQVRDGPSGSLVYDRTIDLDRSLIDDVYDWFFADVVMANDAFVDDLPPYPNARLTVSISGSGTVACGVMTPGEAVYLGATKYGAKVGIQDFSRKTTDDFGVTTVLQRSYRKLTDQQLMVDNYRLDPVFRTLASLRSTLCLWVGVDVDRTTFAPFIVYGFYKDFSLEVQYLESSLCSIQIEGVI